jgi:ATP-binding cassette, subfamily B, bacterial
MKSEISIDNVPEKRLVTIYGDVRFENISFAYPARQDITVLHDLTLIARAGETTALVGLSGCGEC